jgi:nucleoid-associated protein YgaU
MGLFSFLKNAGSKIFNKKEEEKPKVEGAERMAASEVANRQKAILLKGIVTSLKLPVEDLDIDVKDDHATVRGEVPTQADREKVILAVGNVEGIAVVEDDLRVVKPEPEATFYEVKKGDYLSKIAKEQYGDAMKYMIIFEANKPMLKDPDLIYPGQVLRIPPLD